MINPKWLTYLYGTRFSSLRDITNHLRRAYAASVQLNPEHGSQDSMNDNNEDYFGFTRGRFVADEQYEMSTRYVHYDLRALARVAAEAVGSDACIRIEKCTEGVFNKALLLTMNDTIQVIAKIPNPNAGEKHLTTASEVATMTFMREKLNTPVPRIFAWQSNIDGDNAVGAEYIIMEKCAGVQIQKLWPKMPFEDRGKLVKEILHFEKAWSSCKFQQYGGLYFKHSLAASTRDLTYTGTDGQQIIDSNYTIGPSTGRQMYDARRSELSLDRGPWDTVESYAAARGKRDAQCVRQLTELPKPLSLILGPGLYVPSREKKLRAYAWYDKVYKYMLPVDPNLTAPCLWHGDLHDENIFVDPEDPTKIVGIIDWQGSEILPLYERGYQPFFIDNPGEKVKGLDRPRLPHNYKQLPPEEKSEAHKLYSDQLISSLYRTLLHRFYPVLYQAQQYLDTDDYSVLKTIPLVLSESAEAMFCGNIIEIMDTWSELPGVRARGSPPCPIEVSPEEKAEIMAECNATMRGIQILEDAQKVAGDDFPDKGIVTHEQYEGAKDALRQLKEQMIEHFAKSEDDIKVLEELWQFDD